MNAWKNNKLSFLLVTGSMILLLFFQVFWLNNIYQNEKDNLREKADLVFEDAVRSIEDSLFQKILWDTSGIQMAKDAQVKIKIMDSEDENDFNHISSIRKEIKHLKGDTLFELNIDMRSNFRQESAEKSFGSVVMFMASDTSSNLFNNSASLPIEKQILLAKKLEKLIPKSDFPSPYELAVLENDKLEKEGLYLSLIHI